MAGKDRIPIFRERLVSLRKKELKMTQEEFAEHVGIARPTVGLYESGERIPDVGVLAKIARACGKSADWLLGLSDVDEVDEVAQAAAARYGLNNSSLEALESLVAFQGEEVDGRNIDYRSALNALLPTKQFILLLRYMEFAKESREYAKREEEERRQAREQLSSGAMNFETAPATSEDEIKTWSLEKQVAFRKQELDGFLAWIREGGISRHTERLEGPIKRREAMDTAKNQCGAWLDAADATDHYAQQAAKWLDEAISAYYDGRSVELDIFQRDGDPDA